MGVQNGSAAAEPSFEVLRVSAELLCDLPSSPGRTPRGTAGRGPHGHRTHTVTAALFTEGAHVQMAARMNGETRRMHAME